MKAITLFVVVVAQFAALVLVSSRVGTNGWDDGAITLAFSRTAMQSGTIALTPSSETVEGFSSVAWFLWNALLAWFRPSFEGAIFGAQVSSAATFCIATVLLSKRCEMLALSTLSHTLVVVAFAAWGAAFSECVNGMEMGLLAVGMLGLSNHLISAQPRAWTLGLWVFLVLSTRFEAVFYVGALVPLLWACQHRRLASVILSSLVLFFVLITLWRWVVFHDFVPNTIWAKQWAPYRRQGVGNLVQSAWRGAIELLRFFVIPILFLSVFLRKQLRTIFKINRVEIMHCSTPVLAALGVNFIIGHNWGYLGRMSLFAVPFVLLLMGIVVSRDLSPQSVLRRLALVAVFIGAVSTSHHLSFPSAALSLAKSDDSLGVTPRAFAKTGDAALRIVRAAGIESATFLSPDVGGPALAYQQFRVVDLAMLANQFLAHRGYGALSSVIEREKPHVVEAHWDWALQGHLYSLKSFHDNYVPAYVQKTRFWVRREVAEQVIARKSGCFVSMSNPVFRSAVEDHRYRNDDDPQDRAAFESAATILVIDEKDAADAWCS
jgi:hypothetical protein